MRVKFSILCAVSAALCVHQASAATIYNFTRLNPGGAVIQFNSGGINNNGIVASEVNNHLFTYNIGTGIYTNYNTVVPSQMGGIDDLGRVVYTLNSGSNFIGAVFDTNTSTQTTFSDPNAPQFTFASGVSSNGNNIAGYYDDASFNQFGFLKTGATFTDISYPGPHGQIYIWDTNNAGDVVGLSSCCRAGVNFLKQGSTYTTILNPLGSASNGTVYGLNNQDQLVGWYDNGTGGPIHGMIWQAGLSSTLDFPGANSTVLQGINDSGVIFGAATDASGTFLFVASPTTPEPATFVLIGGALCAIGLRLRKRSVQTRNPPAPQRTETIYNAL